MLKTTTFRLSAALISSLIIGFVGVDTYLTYKRVYNALEYEKCCAPLDQFFRDRAQLIADTAYFLRRQPKTEEEYIRFLHVWTPRRYENLRHLDPEALRYLSIEHNEIKSMLGKVGKDPNWIDQLRQKPEGLRNSDRTVITRLQQLQPKLIGLYGRTAEEVWRFGPSSRHRNRKGDSALDAGIFEYPHGILFEFNAESIGVGEETRRSTK